jgi:hypothetical protein
MTPFDYLNAINQTKEDLSNDPLFEKDYVPFIVNRGLSYFVDTCLYANELNCRSSIPKEWQFSYLLNSITKKKRFSKWHKKDALGDNLAMVMEYYNYSTEKAKVALSILSEEQLVMIKQKFEKGGKL